MAPQIKEGYRLNWLLTASFFQSKVFHPTLFWSWMHHCRLPTKFPMLSYLEVDLIDLDLWHQFFSDSLGLIKVTLCCLKLIWWGEIHQLCPCLWHPLLILQILHLLKTWGGHLHQNSFGVRMMQLFKIFVKSGSERSSWFIDLPSKVCTAVIYDTYFSCFTWVVHAMMWNLYTRWHIQTS